MKTSLLVLSLCLLTLSFQASAKDNNVLIFTGAVSVSPLLSTALTTAISTGNYSKEAAQVLAEGQDYLQAGEMSLLISQKVKGLQNVEVISDDEAVDLLMMRAQEILSNN